MFGSHLSIAGAMVNALAEAQKLKLDTVQVFTKNQRQWKVPPLDSGAARDWLAEQSRLGWAGRTVSHDSYLINLASPTEGADGFWERSIAMMRDEIERCQSLSIPFLVSHPGAHMLREDDLSPAQRVERGSVRIAKAYKRVLRETRGYNVIVCLEATAGGGTTLGRTFEELAHLRELILNEAGKDAAGRIGFCIDSCHVLAAGYDIAAFEAPSDVGTDSLRESVARQAKPRKRTFEQGVTLGRALLDEFDRVCGIENLRVLHLNDSKGARGSFLDRHAHIGKGQVALGAFAAIVGDPRLAGVPKIMETPKENDPKGTPMDTVNLKELKKLAAKMMR